MSTIVEALGANPGETIVEALGGNPGETIADVIENREKPETVDITFHINTDVSTAQMTYVEGTGQPIAVEDPNNFTVKIEKNGECNIYLQKYGDTNYLGFSYHYDGVKEEGKYVLCNTLTEPEQQNVLGFAKSASAKSPTVTDPFIADKDTDLYVVWEKPSE